MSQEGITEIRSLGEHVGTSVTILGWVEGFKAISDVYGFCAGEFLGVNPELQKNITLINKKPYGDGWLYEARGTLDDKCVDAEGYAAILNQTIDKMLGQQKAQE